MLGIFAIKIRDPSSVEVPSSPQRLSVNRKFWTEKKRSIDFSGKIISSEIFFTIPSAKLSLISFKEKTHDQQSRKILSVENMKPNTVAISPISSKISLPFPETTVKVKMIPIERSFHSAVYFHPTLSIHRTHTHVKYKASLENFMLFQAWKEWTEGSIIMYHNGLFVWVGHNFPSPQETFFTNEITEHDYQNHYRNPTLW